MRHLDPTATLRIPPGPDPLSNGGESVAERRQRLPIPARRPRRWPVSARRTVSPKRDQREQPQQHRRGAVDGRIGRLPLGLDAKMTANLGEGDFDGPTPDEPPQNIERRRIKVGAQERLRFALACWVAHQNVTDWHAVTGMVPHRGGGDDLKQSLASAVPSAHQQRLPTSPGGWPGAASGWASACRRPVGDRRCQADAVATAYAVPRRAAGG